MVLTKVFEFNFLLEKSPVYVTVVLKAPAVKAVVMSFFGFVKTFRS